MTLVVIGYIALTAYSAWVTYSVLKITNKLTYVKAELEIARGRVQSLSMEMLRSNQMYEERLKAKQEAIDAFKKLLGDIDDIDKRALDYSNRLSEAPTPPLGSFKDDPTR